jgi:hypothetical protein
MVVVAKNDDVRNPTICREDSSCVHLSPYGKIWNDERSFCPKASVRKTCWNAGRSFCRKAAGVVRLQRLSFWVSDNWKDTRFRQLAPAMRICRDSSFDHCCPFVKMIWNDAKSSCPKAVMIRRIPWNDKAAIRMMTWNDEKSFFRIAAVDHHLQ